MGLYGVIDLGSNSIRLVIYEVKHGKRFTGTPSFRSIVDEKTMAGLAAYVVDGVFTEDGVRKAVTVLSEQLVRARDLNVRQVDVFATAVLRNCHNSDQAISAIERKIRKPVHLLSSTAEAHLGYVGASFQHKMVQGALIDIGGGSTEITHIEKSSDVDGCSIGQGSVSSYAAYVAMVLPSQEEMAAIREAFTMKLDEMGSVLDFSAPVVYGIGGSIRAAAKMMGAAFFGGTHPKNYSLDELRQLLSLYENDPSSFAHLAVKSVPERIHTLLPGCVLIDTVMGRLGAERMEICKYGVREGYLIERMLHR